MSRPMSSSSSSSDVFSLACDYLRWSKHGSEDWKEVSRLVQEKEEGELGRLLSSRVAFGTAGIRARMGPG